MENKSKLKIIKDLINITGLSEDEKIEAISKILTPEKEPFNVLTREWDKNDLHIDPTLVSNGANYKGDDNFAKNISVK